MSGKQQNSRRRFLKLAATSSLALGAAPAVLADPRRELRLEAPARPVSPNDRVRIATIGMGGMGFGDTQTALRVPGIEFVAAADAYDGRLKRTKETLGKDVFTTRDYREVLARPDVDAVIIATPDHWHRQMAIDAMEAGKHVYIEKPMVQDIEEGPLVIEAQRRTGRVVQVGSQRVSSIIYNKAKELFESGAIGQLNMVEAYMNRNSATGAWQYSIPPDASPETVDWDRFLGDAPKRPFDATRFFRWRNYWDYGTGIPGDLFVHLYSGIHHVLSSNGPSHVMASGGLRFWKDGRDAPDVMMGVYEYPETKAHPAFTLGLKVNFANGGGGGEAFRFIGDEGMIEIGYNNVTLTRLPPRSEAPGYTIGTFDEATQQAFLKDYRARYPEPEEARVQESAETVFRAPSGYNDRLDHFANFFDAVRAGKPAVAVEDAVFGYRAAAPALLTNLSYRDKRVYSWDPEAMRVIA